MTKYMHIYSDRLFNTQDEAFSNLTNFYLSEEDYYQEIANQFSDKESIIKYIFEANLRGSIHGFDIFKDHVDAANYNFARRYIRTVEI